MRRNMLKTVALIMIAVVLSTVVLGASAAGYICRPQTLVAVYDTATETITYSGTYTGVMEESRVYMFILNDDNGAMINISNVEGSELDMGNGYFEYSFYLSATVVENKSLPLSVNFTCVTANVLEPINAEVRFIDSSNVIYGDVTGDGVADNMDAARVLRYDAGMIDDINKAAADVNGDGEVNNIDAALILKYDAGLIEELGR